MDRRQKIREGIKLTNLEELYLLLSKMVESLYQERDALNSYNLCHQNMVRL